MKNKTKELILKANEMKAQELRIGNIVSHGDYSSETFEVLSIEFTDESYIINTKGGKNGTWGNPIEMITKVPLTKDWLLKFGFWHDEETKLYHWGAAGEIRVNIETLEFYSYGNWHIAMVQYVHELQNLCFEVEKAEDLKLEKIVSLKELLKPKSNNEFIVGENYKYLEILKYFCGSGIEVSQGSTIIYESDSITVSEYGDFYTQESLHIKYHCYVPEQANVWFINEGVTIEGTIYKCVYNTLVY